jgi:Tfp pilus assembly protein PilV
MPRQVIYVESRGAGDSGLSLTEVELGAMVLGVGIIGVVGYLLYQKASNVAADAYSSASQAISNAAQDAVNALPQGPGAGVPYTPPDEPLDPSSTFPGYP